MFGLLDASVGGPVGLVVLPLALVAAGLLGWRGQPWPDMIGVVAGCGAASIVIGLLDRAYYEVCPDGKPVVERVGERVVSIASCPYMAPTPWLVIGGLLLATSVSTYVWLRKRLGRPAPDEKLT
jgi:hypothetical protein